VDEKIGRRNLLGTLVGWIFGLTVVGCIIPIIAYLFPKSKGEAENIFMDSSGKPITVSAILKEGSKTGLAFGDATVVISYGGEVRAFSAVCTHLGCIVSWKKDEGIFFCPCHAGKFDSNGNVISGPPPKPLLRYGVKVEGRKINLSRV